MTIQFYGKENHARIFDSTGLFVAELPAVSTTEQADGVLRKLGVKRRERWEGTGCGFEARLRRI